MSGRIPRGFIDELIARTDIVEVVAATVAEVQELHAIARRAGRTLFCAWHSQFAPAVAPAREWLEGRTLRSVRGQRPKAD